MLFVQSAALSSTSACTGKGTPSVIPHLFDLHCLPSAVAAEGGGIARSRPCTLRRAHTRGSAGRGIGFGVGVSPVPPHGRAAGRTLRQPASAAMGATAALTVAAVPPPFGGGTADRLRQCPGRIT